MKYGAMNFPIRPVLHELKKISDLGFDYFELTLDAPCAHYSEIIKIEDKLKGAMQQHSMDLVCHLPTFVYTADLTPGIRKASVEEMVNSLKTAGRLGARKAVLHPGYITGLGPLVMETALNHAHDSLCTIVKEAELIGLTLCLENMFPKYNSFFDPDKFSSVLKTFPELKITLDTGHANIDDPKQTRLYEFIQRFPDRIGHVHVSDNHGRRDDHLGVGKGNIDFKKFMKTLRQAGYDDTITLEIFSGDPDDLVKSRMQLEQFDALL